MENVNKQLLERWAAFGKAMQKAGSELPRHLIAETEQAIASAEQAQQAEPVAWEVSATKGDMPRQTKLLKHEAAALAAADHWIFVGCDVAVRGLVYAQADAAQPPAVAVPDEMESVHDTPFMSADTEPEIAYLDGWNACRDAMLAASQKGGA